LAVTADARECEKDRAIPFDMAYPGVTKFDAWRCDCTPFYLAFAR
jgi:hypothetical protein